MFPGIFTLATLALAPAASAITIYTSLPGSIPTQFLAADGLPAFDTASQVPPPAPTPAAAAGGVSIALPTGSVQGLSKPQRSDFVGISLEMSISDNIIGRNGTFVNPIFLNYIQNLRARSGMISIRIGGNSQEKATLVPAISPPLSGATINKTVDPIALAHNSGTPLLTFSEDLFYAMNNASSLVGIGWYFGLPFLNPSQIQNVANTASTILGSNLLGFQLANEPDQYQAHGNEPLPWGIPDYMNTWGSVRSQYLPSRTDLIAPNVCCSFKIEDVLNAGFLQQFGQYLKFVAIQHYKDIGPCVNNNPLAPDSTPQASFDSYLSHASAQNFWFPYINASIQVAAAGKDFVMLETNTASCGGFAGASDTFAAALYLIDLALQGASVGFSQMLLHNGGVGNFYNLFSPPPANMSTFRQWTTGAPYYSTLVMSEVMSSVGSQVKDLLVNGNNSLTPAYALYKNGQPIRVALFNYVTDPSGANDYQAQISIGGGTTGQASSTPTSVKVKYFSSATGSSADKYNLTWAGQTLGDQFASDGRLQGAEDIITIQCTNGICTVPVKAPQFALVLLDGIDSIPNPVQATQTFATSVQTKIHGGTIIVPPSVLATSNGRGGSQELFNIGGSSSGSAKSEATAVRAAVGMVLLGVVSGAAVLASFGRW
ncbi:hypothetical protein FRB94_001223 [Tulasnella sp. JGI-2019a]|nr:hypothetical protein FRB94_001223 [Tulasnella sp. JGI-2019a]